VRNLARDAHLIAEARHHRFAHRGTAKEFQRYRLTKDDIVSTVDLAHPALTQQTQNAISPDQHHAGGKAAFVGGG
jgi:hypothetical protein